MRILIFGLNYAPELTGIGKYTGEMASWLAERGHAVHVVTAPPYYPAWRISDEYRGLGYVTEGGGPAADGVGEPLVFRCPLYVPEEATGLKRVLHLFSFAASAAPIVMREVLLPRGGSPGPDVIWTVEPTFFGAPVALAAASLAQAPAWLHVQDFEVDAAFDLGLLPANGKIHASAVGLEAVLTRTFARASSISVRMVERLLRKGVRPEQTVLFPNWVDVDQVLPSPVGAPNPFRSSLGLEGKVVLLYSGNMGSKQGLELLPALARALADDPSIHFLFCGDGAFRPTMESLVKGMDNVTLMPLQPLEALNDLLNCADIHLLPQRADAADLVMPSKLTGMLSSGRPAIVTAQAGTQVAAVVSGVALGTGSPTHEPCGVVVPAGDLAALVEAVHELVADPARRASLGAAARRFAVEHMGKEKVLEQFEQNLLTAVRDYRNGVR
ncbi:WcaI family glycosyltransferase [Terriglobus roseus]|uniref:Colanic acid biosynthesis glycosyl transferase WcaI n=1 Tax=Terriglobus roseus TaxID=392734 RepID=A0A1H4S8Q4_9BACT|nr:WcaI family glycosyltransferase [Terriglobus roseus]SEC40502.1 colanic acid biosynthesis glycosyl transferase WcaI [Terriglobus roseus]